MGTSKHQERGVQLGEPVQMTSTYPANVYTARLLPRLHFFTFPNIHLGIKVGREVGVESLPDAEDHHHRGQQWKMKLLL
jgi:hypothetical protein